MKQIEDNKNNIENHLQKIAVLKQTSQTFEKDKSTHKQDFLHHLHDIYTRGISYQIEPQSVNTIVKQEIAKYENNCNKIASSNILLASEIATLETEFIEAGNFDTKAFTKYLATKLTELTSDTWIPIRYLLQAYTATTPQREGYAVICKDSLLNFSNMGETITLLDNPSNISAHRYNIKYTEKDHPDVTFYSNVNEDDMQNIWQMSSYNFISIADTKKFNAFFNTNKTQTKPFLHIPLSTLGQNVLNDFDEHLPTFRHYNKPQISQNHPRAIATQVLTDLVNERLEKEINISKNIEDNIEF